MKKDMKNNAKKDICSLLIELDGVEPDCCELLNEADIEKKFKAVIDKLNKQIRNLGKFCKDIDDLDKQICILQRSNNNKDTKEAKKVAEAQKENAEEEECSAPDPNKVERIVENKKLTLEECCDSPAFQEYLDNVNRWSDLEGRRRYLENRLDTVKSTQKKVLKKCRAFEDSLDKFNATEMMKAALKSMIKGMK